MARPDLLRIDDVLLRLGTVLALVWGAALALALAGVFGPAAVTLPWALLVLGASAPLAAWITGYQLRRRERRAWALKRLVDEQVELPASDLLRDSDFTQVTLDRAIRDLNNAGASFLVWDRESDRIQDGRLRTAILEVEQCDACGAKLELRLRVGDASSACCPYCHAPIGSQRLVEERARLMAERDDERAARGRARAPGQGFSVALFALLLCIFWPAGVGYAIWHWRAELAGD